MSYTRDVERRVDDLLTEVRDLKAALALLTVDEWMVILARQAAQRTVEGLTLEHGARSDPSR